MLLYAINWAYWAAEFSIEKSTISWCILRSGDLTPLGGEGLSTKEWGSLESKLSCLTSIDCASFFVPLQRYNWPCFFLLLLRISGERMTSDYTKLFRSPSLLPTLYCYSPLIICSTLEIRSGPTMPLKKSSIWQVSPRWLNVLLPWLRSCNSLKMAISNCLTPLIEWEQFATLFWTLPSNMGASLKNADYS